MTQNQLIELFETEQLKGIVERSEERGWVDPAELEAFVTEQEIGSEEVEQITRELEAMGLEVGLPKQSEEEKAKEAAEAAVWASEALSGAADVGEEELERVGRARERLARPDGGLGRLLGLLLLGLLGQADL